MTSPDSDSSYDLSGIWDLCAVMETAATVSFSFSTEVYGPVSCAVDIDWRDFEAWLRIEGGAKRRGLAPRTVQNTMADVRRMTEFGVDWPAFTQGPDEARAAVRPYLDAKKVRGALHAVENAQKALNRLGGYLDDVLHRPGFTDRLWRLQEVPDRKFKPYSEAERRALLSYRHPKPFYDARRRAELFLFDHIGHRQLEVYQILVEDFDPYRCALRVDDPVKGGLPRVVALPDATFQPGSPLVRWLRIRARVAGSTGPVWVRKDGLPMDLNSFHNEMWAIGKAVGVRANHNRWRHTVGSHREERGVAASIQRKEWGHRSESSTAHYFQGRPEARRDVLIEAGVRGYDGSYRPPQDLLADAWWDVVD